MFYWLLIGKLDGAIPSMRRLISCKKHTVLVRCCLGRRRCVNGNAIHTHGAFTAAADADLPVSDTIASTSSHDDYACYESKQSLGRSIDRCAVVTDVNYSRADPEQL